MECGVVAAVCGYEEGEEESRGKLLAWSRGGMVFDFREEECRDVDDEDGDANRDEGEFVESGEMVVIVVFKDWCEWVANDEVEL